MSDPKLEKAYQKQLLQRAKNVAQNEARGLSLANMAGKGVPMDLNTTAAADTLSDVVNSMKGKTNLENVIKTAEGYAPGINANVRGGLYDGAVKANHAIEDISEAIPESSKILRNAKGFSKLLPMLGLGGAALAASSIYNKAQAGDMQGAALEGLDQVTDHVPGIGTAKMALQSDALGEGEDAQLKKLQAEQLAEEQNSPDNRRFAKIRQLMANK